MACEYDFYNLKADPKFNAHSVVQSVSGLILSPVVNEFGTKSEWLKLGQGLGLLVGCTFWGAGSDAWGRRYVLCLITTPMSS